MGVLGCIRASVSYKCSICRDQQREVSSPRDWSYKWFWAFLWILGTKPTTSGRAAGARHCWASSLALVLFIFKRDAYICEDFRIFFKNPCFSGLHRLAPLTFMILQIILKPLINWDPHLTVHQPPAQRSGITGVGVEVWGLSYWRIALEGLHGNKQTTGTWLHVSFIITKKLAQIMYSSQVQGLTKGFFTLYVSSFFPALCRKQQERWWFPSPHDSEGLESLTNRSTAGKSQSSWALSCCQSYQPAAAVIILTVSIPLSVASLTHACVFLWIELVSFPVWATLLFQNSSNGQLKKQKVYLGSLLWKLQPLISCFWAVRNGNIVMGTWVRGTWSSHAGQERGRD